METTFLIGNVEQSTNYFPSCEVKRAVSADYSGMHYYND